MSGEYLTLSAPGEAETRVRGSRFVAVAFPAVEESEVRRELEARNRRFFDATHHCAAWRLRGGEWRALDAGEPGGSAGAPILAAIDGEGLLDVAVVVTRYFGGTKLGVGGLVRAYGEAAAAALAGAPRVRAVPAVRMVVRYGHQYTGAVMRALERFAAGEIQHDFEPDSGRPVARFDLPAADAGEFARNLAEHTAGEASAESVGETIAYRPLGA